MKKVLLSAAFLFTALNYVNAQESTVKTEKTSEHKMNIEQRAQKQVDDMNSVATLTDDQKVKIKEFAITKITKTEAIKAKYKNQPESAEIEKTEIEAVRKDFQKNAKALLTPEQLEKVKAKKRENKASTGTDNTNTGKQTSKE